MKNLVAKLKGMFVDPTRLGQDHYMAQRTLLELGEFFRDAIAVERLSISVFLNLGAREEIYEIERGIDFFSDPGTFGDRYENEASTIERAVRADGGRMAQAHASRAAAQGS